MIRHEAAHTNAELGGILLPARNFIVVGQCLRQLTWSVFYVIHVPGFTVFTGLGHDPYQPVPGAISVDVFSSKSGQPRLGPQTAEDAEGRRERPALIVLCEPLRPLRFDYLYQSYVV